MVDSCQAGTLGAHFPVERVEDPQSSDDAGDTNMGWKEMNIGRRGWLNDLLFLGSSRLDENAYSTIDDPQLGVSLMDR